MKLLHAVRASCVAVALASTPLAFAQAPRLPAGITQVTTVEGITEYRLDNGLQVLLFRDPSKATITVNMTYLVGSVDESNGETGMAHLLEHMMFKGSTKYPDILAAIRSRGAQFNGTTSWDRTNYFETFDASDANLEWAIDLEADRMVNAFVAQKDLDTEMTVVRNEFESGENDPFGVLFERVQSSAYVWHGYGKSPIGSRSDIENVPIERLQAFYQTPLPTRQRRARRRRPLRGTASARPRSRASSARSRGRSASSSTTTPSSRLRTASARSSCAASATCRSSWRATTLRRARTPISCRCNSRPRSSPTSPPGASTKRSSSRALHRTSELKSCSCATRAPSRSS